MAILSAGFVSASDDLGSEDAIHASDDDSEDVLKDGSYWDNDFYITVQENYSQDKSDWQSRELIYVSSYSQNNATLNILVDDVEKANLTITDGYFSKEDDGLGGTYNKYYACIYPDDLGLDCGTYDIKVNLGSQTLLNSHVTLKEKDDFDIWMQNPYCCEEDYWSSPSFIVIDSNHFNNGTLEIIVNGSKKLNYTLTDGNFEAVVDCSNRSRYIAPSDLLDGYGKFDIEIRLMENGVSRTLINENVSVAEFEPTVNAKLEIGFDLYYMVLPADNVVHIYLPREATGRLTVSYNDVKNETVSYYKGYATHCMASWNLNHLGENTVTVTYVGDDFGTLTATGTVIVLPEITAPSYVSIGEEFEISVLTHDWVWGDFNVYDYYGDVKGELLAHDEIYKRPEDQFATASVRLSSDKAGLNRYYLEFDYPGGDYPIIHEVYVVENSRNVSVNVSRTAKLGSDVVINISAPPSPFNFAYVSVDGDSFDMFSMEMGKASKTVCFLTAGYHKISVQYDGRYCDYEGNYVGDIYSDTFHVNVGYETEIISKDVNMVYGSSKELTINLKDEFGNNLSLKDIKIRLNGKTYIRTTDENGSAALPLNLDCGNYVADISFDESPGYFASNQTAKITVTKLTTKLTAPKVNTVYNGGKYLVITLKDANNKFLAGKYVSVKIAGKTYTKKTDNKGQVKLAITLSVKTYSAAVNFNGDNNYFKSSAKTQVVVTKASPKLTSPNKSFKVKTRTKKVTATLKDNKGKVIKNAKVTLKVNGKTYTAKSSSKGIATFNVKLTKKGNYKATFKYGGNTNFKSVSKTIKITIKK